MVLGVETVSTPDNSTMVEEASHIKFLVFFKKMPVAQNKIVWLSL